MSVSANSSFQLDTRKNDDPIFSNEIFKLIIDEVASNKNRPERKSDLCLLACVSLAFAHLCQAHLFSTVTITLENGIPNLQKVSEQRRQTLASNPRIVSYVRHLRCFAFFLEGIIPGISLETRWKDHPQPNASAILQYPHITALTLDTNASYLKPRPNDLGIRHIIDHYLSTHNLISLNIDGGKELPLLHILACPTLRHLSFNRCGFARTENDLDLARALQTGFNIKTLNIVGAEWVAKCTQALDLLYAHCHQLGRISVEWSNITAEQIVAGPVRDSVKVALPIQSPVRLNFAKLRSVVSQKSVDWRYLCTIAQSSRSKAFPRLQHLTLKVSSAHDVQCGPNVMFEHIEQLEGVDIEMLKRCQTPPDMARCTVNPRRTLNAITLRWCQVHEANGSSPVSALCSALVAVERDNVLENIVLVFELDANESEYSSLHLREWSGLDALLMDDGASHRFPHLKSIEVQLVKEARYLVAEEIAAARELVKRSMSRVYDAWSHAHGGGKGPKCSVLVARLNPRNG
ncbi:hypothetical protein BJ165DRAFT_1616090 [Panaeolus papilionaceus]|nr:hypothetical protein BJ165DRAFT_1616090 [Panaeolus papilionaceus]